MDGAGGAADVCRRRRGAGRQAGRRFARVQRAGRQGPAGAPDHHRTAEPVYRQQDGKLEVLLVNTMCDAYDSYIGTLRAGRFSGAHVQYGWGSRTVGQVSGVFIAKQ
jgi:hypothetical protein